MTERRPFESLHSIYPYYVLRRDDDPSRRTETDVKEAEALRSAPPPTDRRADAAPAPGHNVVSAWAIVAVSVGLAGVVAFLHHVSAHSHDPLSHPLLRDDE